MNKMMEEFNFGWPEMKVMPVQWGMGEFTPVIDVTDEEKRITVEAEIPGMDQEDLDVTLTTDSLIIKGEKKRQRTEEEETNCYRERCFGSFKRIIPLSAEIDRDNVRARFKNGVLTVIMPKSEEAIETSRRIEISPEQQPGM